MSIPSGWKPVGSGIVSGHDADAGADAVGARTRTASSASKRALVTGNPL
jgi:hypothetical protein